MQLKNKHIIVTFCLISILLLGCSERMSSISKGRWVKTQLYFGMSIPGGGKVEEADWQAFLDKTVSPLFKEGFTVFEAYGLWQGDDGAPVRELSRVIALVYVLNKETAQKIETIMQVYCDQFQQEAVLKIDHKIRLEFYSN